MNTRQNFVALTGIGHHVKFVRDLAVEPEFRAVAKVGSKAHRRISGDTTLASNNALNTALRHSSVQPKASLAYSHGLQEVLIQNFTWMHGQHAVTHGVLLMIINNFNKMSIPILPNKTNSPLAVDADAMLPASISLESFQPIPKGNAQVIQRDGVVQDFELAHGNTLDVWGQANDTKSQEQFFCPTVFRAHYHDNKITLKTYYCKRIVGVAS